MKKLMMIAAAALISAASFAKAPIAPVKKVVKTETAKTKIAKPIAKADIKKATADTQKVKKSVKVHKAKTTVKKSAKAAK